MSQVAPPPRSAGTPASDQFCARQSLKGTSVVTLILAPFVLPYQGWTYWVFCQVAVP